MLRLIFGMLHNSREHASITRNSTPQTVSVHTHIYIYTYTHRTHLQPAMSWHRNHLCYLESLPVQAEEIGNPSLGRSRGIRGTLAKDGTIELYTVIIRNNSHDYADYHCYYYCKFRYRLHQEYDKLLLHCIVFQEEVFPVTLYAWKHSLLILYIHVHCTYAHTYIMSTHYRPTNRRTYIPTELATNPKPNLPTYLHNEIETKTDKL